MNQLLEAYLWATEVNLATLSELAYLKSSSKSRINRQKSICTKMLQVCQEYGSEIEWHGWNEVQVGRQSCSRVKELLATEAGRARGSTCDGSPRGPCPRGGPHRPR